MRIMLDVFSEPIQLNDDKVTVICIENKLYFRKIVSALCDGYTEEQNIVFSKNYEPFRYKNNVLFISDYYNLQFSSAFMKKIYDNISFFCEEEIQEETIKLKQMILDYFDIILQNYSYDFSCKDDVTLAELFKIQNLQPLLEKDDLLDALLEYILLTQKYSPVKVFVLLNLHTNFSEEELKIFYKDLIQRKIPIMVLESNSEFEKSVYEKITIIDKDLCEIIENI